MKSGTMTGHKRLIESVATGLNEYAEAVYAGRPLLSHRPSSPLFWFAGLAIDSGVAHWKAEHQAQLSQETIDIFDTLHLEEYGKDDKWCECLTRDTAFLLHRERTGESFEWKGRTIDPCWPCLFGAHDRCSWFGEIGGCQVGAGEIHFHSQCDEVAA